jgi:hypothetical protein
MSRVPSFSSEIAEARYDTSLKIWRAVEAQHVVSTLRLTDNDAEAQELLEAILEEHKPAPPADTKGLHYLLATPFRYPPARYGSRFRAWPDPGVLYGALARRTACAEMGYWRWRFVQDSDGLTEIAAAPQTLFQAGVKGSAVDLQQPPFAAHASDWTNPSDYSATQAFGRQAREADVDLILYRSVRDPEPQTCVAVLRPEVLRPKRPLAQETWHLTVTSDGAVWRRERNHWSFRFGNPRQM